MFTNELRRLRRQTAIAVVSTAFATAYAPIPARAVLREPTCVDPPPDMVAWYPADDCWPTDLLGNHDGTYVGDAVCTENWKVGGGALGFLTGTYVEVLNAPGLNFGMGELSIDAWIRTSADGYRPIIENQPNNNPAPGYALRLQSGKLEFVVCDNMFTCGSVLSNRTVNDGSWHHVGATLSRGDTSDLLVVYIDGVPEAPTVVQSPTLGNINSTADCLLIGAGWSCGPPGPTFFFDGEMDEVEIFSRALDPTEILAIYQADSAGKCKRLVCVDPPADMVAWYTADDCGLTDFLGNHDGTFIGMAFCPSEFKVGGGALGFFPGTYARVPNALDLNIGTGELTIDAWIRTTADGDRPIVDKQFPGYSIGLEDGQVRFDLCTSSSCIDGPRTSATVNDGFWHHVAVTLSRGATCPECPAESSAESVDQVDIYIDGAVKASAPLGNLGDITSSYDLLIGAGPSFLTPGQLTNFFDGEMDEVEIFSRALDPTEILAIYQADSAGKCKVDCNANNNPDNLDILEGSSADCNANGVPDECDVDCNSNGVPDECDTTILILYVDAHADPSGGNCGTDWFNAFTDLQAALSLAERIPAIEEIWVAAGTYTPTGAGGHPSATFQLQTGLRVRGGFAGSETRIDQRDLSINVTTLNGDLNGDDVGLINNDENCFHVVNGSGVDATALLDGFTITGGNAGALGGQHASGGGVYISNGSPTIANCTIAGNTAGSGTGIFCSNGSNPAITNCMITRNFAGLGAGILCQGGSSPVITNCTITQNTAFSGAGVQCTETDGSIPIITNTILWRNSPDEINGCAAQVRYSDVQGGWTNDDCPAEYPDCNIDTDPLFADADGEDNDLTTWEDNDFHLSKDSRCSDAGDNDALIGRPCITDVDCVPGVEKCLLVEENTYNCIVTEDLDGSARRADNREIDDLGNAGALKSPIVDMGAYEFAYCLADVLDPPLEIEGQVDFEATVDGIVPPTGAFHHPCLLEGNDECKPAFFANEPGAVTISWVLLDGTVWPETYQVGRCVGEDRPEGDGDPRYRVAATSFFKAYPDATVVLSGLYPPTIRYNATISENLPEQDTDPPRNPDIKIFAGGQVQVDADCPDGRVVVQYGEYVGGPLMGFEVVNINSNGPTDVREPQDIGRHLVRPAEVRAGKYCRAVMIQNIELDGVKVAWQRGQTTDIYPIRPEENRSKFVVALYKGTPVFENCWPAAVNRYTTHWPDNPQLQVIDQGADVGEAPAGALVDLNSEVYCGFEVMYQEAFVFGNDPPFGHVTPAGEFGARNPGYSVLRFDRQPDEISDCGDWVTFEVVASYDRLDPMVLAPADTEVAWPIGTELACVGNDCGCVADCDEYFDDEVQTYPFGFLFIPDGQNSPPYDVEAYEDTGQIFPVNSSDVHGVLEAWWYENAAYAEGTYWPNKVATYDAGWNVDDGEIVIASRRGASDYPGDLSNYPPGSQIYEVGAIDDVEDFPPGYNPNDEHAILLPYRLGLNIYAVRNDDPWDVQSGHPWVLVQYPDPDREGLRKMGVHSVVAEDLQDDFYYTEFTAVDSDCLCGDDGTCAGGWSEGLACTSAEDCICEIDLPVVAGQPIDPLFPVNLAAAVCKDDQNPPQPTTWVERVTGDALWVDRKGGIWAVEEVDDVNPAIQSTAHIHIWENWAGDLGCQPWLEYGPGDCCATNSCNDNGFCGGEPWPVTYDPTWPPVEGVCGEDGKCQGGTHHGDDCTAHSECGCNYPEDSPCSPLRHVGASFDQSGQCGSIEILHDTVGVRILDPRREVSVYYPTLDVELLALPPHLYSGEIGGGGEWPDRIWYDYASSELVFRGIMSDRDNAFLLTLDPGCDSPNGYCNAVADLYAASRVQVTDLDFVAEGSSKFVSLADQGVEEGWVTLAFQNDQACVDVGLPVSLEVWRVECPPDQGFIRPIQPVCPLSEKLVLQFSGDAGGEPEKLYYQWQWSLDYDRNNPLLATWNDYNPPADYLTGRGLREVLIEGASIFTLQDSYWRMRYRGYLGCPCTEDDVNDTCNEHEPYDPDDDWTLVDNGTPSGENTQISDWTEPQLAEGWVKRVIRGLNPFDQRVEQFHTNDAATYVDMILQAGNRFVDPVPLNCTPDNIDSVGLIELYETVLRRARSFSIDQGFSMPGITTAILLATGKIADLHMLLGNEAYADAMDPTIGTFALAGDSSAGYDPHAVFCFEEQVESLLAEELALLRGRSDFRSPDYDADEVLVATVDNRLPWNFTSGNGQVAYANNYQLLDVEEAMTTYPQGHGDAWGYYLTALRKFYVLLVHPIFDWVVTTEEVLVHGQPVAVGFKYERKFAQAAAANARTGAAITSLTFRQLYDGEPLSQQLGYPDPQANEIQKGAWGVADWARRAGQGAYLDWVVANSLLPAINIGTCSNNIRACENDEDCDNDAICLDHSHDIQRIDRTTVPELREIAASYSEIQSILDRADAGLNPLGLASDVVPFGLDPTQLEEGATHFDQVYQRALVGLNNAAIAFDYANQNTQRLKSMHDDVDRFDDLVEEREMDFKGRLIEVFGRPHTEDIGVGGSYPAGYVGPDLVHFAYVDPSDLIAVDNSKKTTTIKVEFDKPNFGALGDVGQHLEQETDQWVVEFNVSTDGLGLVKPDGWGARPEPGEIQFTLAELLQTIARYQQALERYEMLLDQIQDQADLLRSLFDLNEDALGVMNQGLGKQIQLNKLIKNARFMQLLYRKLGSSAVLLGSALAETLPQNLIVGIAAGGDFTSIPRGAFKTAGAVANEILGGLADLQSLTELQGQQDKEIVSSAQQITITGLQNAYQEDQQVVALGQLIRGLPSARLELYTVAEAIKQATGRYHSAVGRGLRLLEQRTAFRHRTANQISKDRYRDMAFRIFRNDALQKYRAQFDLAARYVYLAAQAYDYETNLLGNDPMGGQRFKTDIVKVRHLGVIRGGVPYVGNGLAGKLAEMAANFGVLRSELGFNSKDELVRTFSLRWELFRIENAVASDLAWRCLLDPELIECQGQTLPPDPPFIVPDLNSWAVYREYCEPLRQDEDPTVREPEPALVIPFSTELLSGSNLFGHTTRGDETLPSDHYAIKIQSVGIRFAQSYASPPLNKQVNVYLVPTGIDRLRVPTDGTVRDWHVLDQTLPMPFPITQDDLRRPNWLAWDSLVGGSAEMANRRRIPTIAACPTTDEECDMSQKLAGRSVWNTRWFLIIPGSQLMADSPYPDDSGASRDWFDWFMNGAYGTGVRDIQLIIKAYGYAGTSRD